MAMDQIAEMYGSWVWIGAMDRLALHFEPRPDHEVACGLPTTIPPRQCSIPSQVAQINHRSGRKPGMPPLSAHIQIIFRFIFSRCLNRFLKDIDTSI